MCLHSSSDRSVSRSEHIHTYNCTDASNTKRTQLGKELKLKKNWKGNMEIAIIAELEQYSFIHLISSASARGLHHGEGVWGDREFSSLPSPPSLGSPF